MCRPNILYLLLMLVFNFQYGMNSKILFKNSSNCSAAITYAQHSTYWCTVYRPLVWFNFHAYWFFHVSAKCNPSFFVGWASCVFGMLELPARTLTYIYRPTTYTHIHTHTYTHTRTYTRTHTHTLTHTHTHTHSHPYILHPIV